MNHAEDSKTVDLSTFFDAKSVAIVGASNKRGKVGFDLVNNLIECEYPGKIIPINPRGGEIQGFTAYKSLMDCPDKIELVVISVPTRFVITVIEEMGKLGIKHVVIITAGFKETGASGAQLEQELSAKLKEHGIRAVGPNCLGLVDAHTPINGSFATTMPLKGNLGFISQSGALVTGILDWSLLQGLGFSRFISVGNKVDVDEVDLIGELQRDKNTDAILAYLEAITRGPEFIEICKEVSKTTPIVVLKSGSSAAGARAASSHTGSMTGADTAYDAAFKKAGVIRARSVEELFDTATAFSSQPLPAGPNVCIITNAGGPGIIATDHAEYAGLELASLSTDTVDLLQRSLPPAAATYNPVDVLGTAAAQEYRVALEATLADDAVDMLLVILTPQGMTEPIKTAETIMELHKRYPNKPVVTSYMGAMVLGEATKLLKDNGIPCFPFPERGITSLAGLWKYAKIRKDKAITDDLPAEFDVDRKKVAAIFEAVRSQNRVALLGSEAIAVARAYGITAPDTKTSYSVNEAIRFAEEIGFPVAMKITSPDIVHKTDIGGVVINVRSAEEVKTHFERMMAAGKKFYPDTKVLGVDVQEMSKAGREMILGATADPQFGHLCMVGAGGIYANYTKDVSFGLVPVTKREAEEMLGKTKIHTILEGVRGEAPTDTAAIVETLQRISQLVADFPDILELDINPLFAFEEGASALDVKITISRETKTERSTEQ